MGDGARGQRSGSGDDVLLARTAATTEEVADELAAKLFASRSLGRLAQKEGSTQQFRKDVLHDRAGGSDVAVDVIRLVVQLIHYRINHHVAGPGIERLHLLRRGTCGD